MIAGTWRHEAATQATRDAYDAVREATEYALKAATDTAQQTAIRDAARYARAGLDGIARALTNDWNKEGMTP